MGESTARQHRRTTNIQLAAQVSRDVELESILLRSAQVEALADETEHLSLAEIRVDQKSRASYRIVTEPRRLKVALEFVLDLAHGQQDAQSPVLHLAAQYMLVYRLPEGSEYAEASLRWFAELNATLNAWPYWRELVHTVAARVGLGSITLPVFRAMPKPVDAQGNLEDAPAEV